MKTPSFWYDKQQSFISRLLTPLSSLYAIGVRHDREKASPARARIPVLCVGNLVAGGSGKTPVAIALMRLIRARQLFRNPAFLCRGYKGTVTGPDLVVPDGESHLPTPERWGDESILLNRVAPTIVSAQRLSGAEYARFKGFDAVILDDGLQHHALRKDFSLCVIDGMAGFGNGCLIPAGPLREPLKEGFSRVDACILVGKDISGARRHIPASIPVFNARVRPRIPRIVKSGEPYVGFCGLGYPEKFRKTLVDGGVNLVDFVTFADHHPYSLTDVARLAEMARLKNARLVTTAKDAIRLPPGTFYIDVVDIDITFEDEDGLFDLIVRKVPAL